MGVGRLKVKRTPGKLDYVSFGVSKGDSLSLERYYARCRYISS